MSFVAHDVSSYGSFDLLDSHHDDNAVTRFGLKYFAIFLGVLIIFMFFIVEIIIGFAALNSSMCSHFSKWLIINGFLLIVAMIIFLWFPNNKTLFENKKMFSFGVIINVFMMIATSIGSGSYMYFTTDINKCESKHISVLMVIAVVISYCVSHVMTFVTIFIYLKKR